MSVAANVRRTADWFVRSADDEVREAVRAVIELIDPSGSITTEPGKWAVDMDARILFYNRRFAGRPLTEQEYMYLTFHEGGHLLHSEKLQIPSWVTKPKAYHKVWNACEDLRMERCMMRQFPGFAAIRNTVGGKLLQDSCMTQQQDILQKKDKFKATFLSAFENEYSDRWMPGRRPRFDPYSWGYHLGIEDVMQATNDLYRKAAESSSMQGMMPYVDAIYRILFEDQDEPEPEDDGDGDTEGEGGESEQDEDNPIEGDDTEPEQDDEGEGEGTGDSDDAEGDEDEESSDTEGDGESQDEGDESEDTEGEQGDTEGEDDDESDEDGESEGEGEPEGEQEGEDTEGDDAEGGDDADDAESDDTEGDDAESDGDEGEGEQPDDSDTEGEGSGPDEDEGEPEPEQDEDEDGDEDSTEGDEPEPDTDPTNLFDDDEEFEQPPADEDNPPATPGAWREYVLAGAANRFSVVMRSMLRKNDKRGKRRGRSFGNIDVSRYYRMDSPIYDYNVFTRRMDPDNPRYALIISVDTSGSMVTPMYGGGTVRCTWEYALEAAATLAEAWRQLRLPFSIFGWGSKVNYVVNEASPGWQLDVVTLRGTNGGGTEEHVAITQALDLAMRYGRLGFQPLWFHISDGDAQTTYQDGIDKFVSTFGGEHLYFIGMNVGHRAGGTFPNFVTVNDADQLYAYMKGTIRTQVLRSVR